MVYSNGKIPKSLHSICRWTFNPGKGGFVPGDMRPEWGGNFSTVDMIRLVAEKIRPRLPDNVELGVEMHYDTEVNEMTASKVADALVDSKLYLAMITPGAHSHYAYGGIASLDQEERELAEDLGTKTVDLAYGDLRKAWHPDADKAPSLIIWNGSFGYDLATIGVREMYEHLKRSIADLCKYEAEKGGQLYIGFEPKPNEGHPAMLVPTVAGVINFWKAIAKEYNVSLKKKGVNKEFGHSEMIGLDKVNDTVEELDDGMTVHMHLNSQGYDNGVLLGGPGKYDIDHGVRVTGANITISRLMQDAGFNRWKGHDMQTRAYDNTEQGIDRVIRSVLSWEACERAAKEMDVNSLMNLLQRRETGKAEDMMTDLFVKAWGYFKEMYKPSRKGTPGTEIGEIA